MQEKFQPTYLYIKRHTITGLLYFGKTTGTEQYLLEQYNGSGEYWKDHLKEHSKENVETIWYCLFTEKEELTKFALMCSEQWGIVKTKDETGKKLWANERPENGIDGKLKGSKDSAETLQKKSIAQSGENNPMFNRYHSEKTKEEQSKKAQGRKQSAETIAKRLEYNQGEEGRAIISQNISKALKGRKQKKVKCLHCYKEGGVSNMKRYHFDNCKKR